MLVCADEMLLSDVASCHEIAIVPTLDAVAATTLHVPWQKLQRHAYREATFDCSVVKMREGARPDGVARGRDRRLWTSLCQTTADSVIAKARGKKRQNARI